MPPHMETLRGQLQAYCEAWQRQAGKELSCWELRLQIRLSLNLYDLITMMGEHRGHEVKKDKGERRDAFLRDQHLLHSLWFKPAKDLLTLLKARPYDACVFEGMHRLDVICHDIESYLRFDIEGTIQALHDVDEGRCIPIQELRNELRRRSNAAVPG
jgi:hypothetical protein